MEMEENLDDTFDIKHIPPEIYSSQQFSDSENGNRKLAWNSCYTEEILRMSKPSSSSASPSQLISFENSNLSSFFPKNSDTDYISNLDQMPKDYYLTSEIINFSSSSAKDDFEGNNQNQDSAKKVSQTRLSTAARTPLQAQEHLMAERRRREIIRQLFISLSKVVPGLKKLDKASLLEDAIDYVKALQERVRVLEEDEIKKSPIDTSKADSSSHKESSIDNSSGIASELAGAEIQARVSDKHVLIKIFCKKEMGLMSRIPCEMEKMHLNVIDIRIMPFGGAALDITILAEMLSKFRGTVKDIVDHLQTIFFNPRDKIVQYNYL